MPRGRVSPTPLTVWLFAVLATSVLVLPAGLTFLLITGLIGLVAADARRSRGEISLNSDVPSTLSRGHPVDVSMRVEWPGTSRLQLRQAVVPHVELTPSEGGPSIEGQLVARRRGRHRLPPLAVRGEGPLGLAARYLTVGAVSEILVYPDLPTARRLAFAVRRGRFREAGLHGRGPLGLGTEFESIRDYLPDDDIRQVNWRATSRLGKPMSNQFRMDHDQDVICLVDTGRLMMAPIGDRTRLDAAIDAASAVAFVADELGDRCGVIAFDDALRRQARPRRSGGRLVVEALLDLEPTLKDSDYDLSFRAVGASKRAFVLVFTDLIEEAAATPLVNAMPFLTRHHVVVVANTLDPDLEASIRTDPHDTLDVYRMLVAVDMLDARRRVARSLSAVGAQVIESDPDSLATACVRSYLRSKARVRL